MSDFDLSNLTQATLPGSHLNPAGGLCFHNRVTYVHVDNYIETRKKGRECMSVKGTNAQITTKMGESRGPIGKIFIKTQSEYKI